MVNGDSDPICLAIAGLPAGLVWFYDGWKNWGKFKLIQATPTSRVQSMAAGLVEIFGKAVPKQGQILSSPRTNSPCLYYRYRVERYVRGRRSGHWSTVTDERKGLNFFLQDQTGQVEVDPAGADIDIPTDTVQTVVNMRYTEYFIAPNDQLYVMGTATPRSPPPESTRNEDLLIVMKGKTMPFYYISDKPEKSVLSGLRWRAAAGIIGGPAIFLLGLAYILYRVIGI